MKKKIILAVLASLIASASFAEIIKKGDSFAEVIKTHNKEDIIALLPTCKTLDVKFVHIPFDVVNSDINSEKLKQRNQTYTELETHLASIDIAIRRAELTGMIKESMNNEGYVFPTELSKDYTNNSACFVSIDQTKFISLFHSTTRDQKIVEQKQ
ncbi:hypothetical protein [Burkholderia cenocepacia]|uniref:hypothetical protein n=1 Tax=Burkholderia cenocepacia TaxID=95486 RepID=UPI0011156282|nr:hypothetical protein [Burkholderia cenocepacia]